MKRCISPCARFMIGLVCFLLGITDGFAQAGRVRLGAEAGAGLAWLRGTEYINDFHKSRLGIASGITFQYKFNESVSLVSGAGFRRKGSSFEIELTDQAGQLVGILHGKENFDYLAVPLLARIETGKRIRFFYNAGPFFGVLLKQTEFTEGYLIIPEITSEQTGKFEKTEFGLAAGAGAEYALTGKLSISVETRLNYGITNTSKFSEPSETIINNAVDFLFGISFSPWYQTPADPVPAP